ncbi:MAG: hypothetical protein ACTHLJ_14115 [Angustibacter sp.]
MALDVGMTVGCMGCAAGGVDGCIAAAVALGAFCGTDVGVSRAGSFTEAAPLTDEVLALDAVDAVEPGGVAPTAVVTAVVTAEDSGVAVRFG